MRAGLETASLGIDKLATIGLATMDDLTSSKPDDSDSDDGAAPSQHVTYNFLNAMYSVQHTLCFVRRATYMQHT